MRLDATPPPSPSVTRRGVVAGAAALAGTVAVSGTAAAATPSPGTARPGRPPAGGDLVIRGGPLLDARLLGTERTAGRLARGFAGDATLVTGDRRRT
ncbi:hypothetical protein [Streptomyces tanashiensis]|uniref:hypothetical protein n=1 Tax=Streptomyces tanashiensis TaxID=67367 RepID=UPI0034334E1B